MYGVEGDVHSMMRREFWVALLVAVAAAAAAASPATLPQTGVRSSIFSLMLTLLFLVLFGMQLLTNGLSKSPSAAATNFQFGADLIQRVKAHYMAPSN